MISALRRWLHKTPPEEFSPVPTEEFTVPILQTGWRPGHGQTRWYRPEREDQTDE